MKPSFISIGVSSSAISSCYNPITLQPNKSPKLKVRIVSSKPKCPISNDPSPMAKCFDNSLIDNCQENVNQVDPTTDVSHSALDSPDLTKAMSRFSNYNSEKKVKFLPSTKLKSQQCDSFKLTFNNSEKKLQNKLFNANNNQRIDLQKSCPENLIGATGFSGLPDLLVIEEPQILQEKPAAMIVPKFVNPIVVVVSQPPGEEVVKTILLPDGFETYDDQESHLCNKAKNLKHPLPGLISYPNITDSLTPKTQISTEIKTSVNIS